MLKTLNYTSFLIFNQFWSKTRWCLFSKDECFKACVAFSEHFPLMYGQRQANQIPSDLCKIRRFTSSSACVKYHPGLRPPFIHSVVSNDSIQAVSEGPDQTARMRRLVWAFAVRIYQKSHFLFARANYNSVQFLCENDNITQLFQETCRVLLYNLSHLWKHHITVMPSIKDFFSGTNNESRLEKRGLRSYTNSREQDQKSD